MAIFGCLDRSQKFRALKLVAYDVSMCTFIGLKFLLIPVDFIFQAFRIYCWSCISLYWFRCFGHVFKCVDTRLCKCWDMRYTDSEFPATAASVNHKDPKGKYYAWMRAFELSRAKDNKDPKLFSNGVDASDLCQGGLGDCWLISAIAALAEFPGLVQRVFVTKETSEWGRYELRLFDISKDSADGGEDTKGSFVNVVIDDRLPCSVDRGFPRTLYLRMNDEGEIWPLLLEKAMAKWAGSYEALDGGHCAWALATLTGWDTLSYTKFGDDAKWTKCRLAPDPTNPRSPHEVQFKTMNEEVDDDAVFTLLKEWEKKDYVMCAASGSGKDTEADSKGGIVQGHAYTLIGVYEVTGIKLVKLRNPWGKFEWSGMWSDNDEAWTKNPEVKKALKPRFADDGIFFMSFEDFTKNYRKVDVCMREISAETDLFLDVAEEDGAAGPAKSCCVGCGKYFSGAGYKVSCGGRVNDKVQARLSWYNRNASTLWSEFKAERAARRSGLANAENRV